MPRRPEPRARRSGSPRSCRAGTDPIPERIPSRARRSRGGALGVAVLLGALLAAGCGRAPRPIPAPPPATELRARLARRPVVAGLHARAGVRLRVNGKPLPALTARLALESDRAAYLQLRPGVLQPVLGLWIDPESWSLGLTRERAFCRAAGESAAAPGARALLRIAGYLLEPHRLAADLGAASVQPHPEGWVLRGRPQGLGGEIAIAELICEPTTLAIRGWNLQLRSGASLLRVLYDPARGASTARGRIAFLVKGLSVDGEILLRRLGESGEAVPQAPEFPSDWRRIPVADLPAWLETVTAEE